MKVLKRAFLYVSRKWQQSLILFLVLLIACTSALTGFAILEASAAAAANLRRQLGGTFSMEIDTENAANMKDMGSTDRYQASYYAGEYLGHTVIDEVMKTSGISEYSANTHAIADLKSSGGEYYNLIENPNNYGSFSNPHAANIQAWTSLHQCAYFANRLLEVTQGEMFTADGSGQAVISRELAQLNHIGVGDMVTVEINSEIVGFDLPPGEACVFEVVGIFDICGEQEIDPYSAPRQMMQNWVFVDSRTLLQYMNGLLESVGGTPIGYNKVTFSVEDPAEMDSIIENIQENKAINWDYFKIKMDNTNYQSAENALKGMDGGVRSMILAIAAAGLGILVLLLSIWAKSRIHETGILLSVGKSKWEILAQRIAESILITALAFGISYACSDMAANEVGNRLLSRANEQTTDKAEENPLHPGLPVSAGSIDLAPVFSAPKVEELNVNVTAGIFAPVSALGVLAVLLSICAASIPIMGMKPNAILTKYE